MALSVLAGLLAAAAFFPWHVNGLILVALAPLLWAVHGQGVGRGIFYGAVAGCVGCGVGFHWVVHLLINFGGFSWPLAVPIFFLWLLSAATLWAAMGAVWGIRRTFPCRGLVMVALPVLLEAFWPRIFYWYFGATLVEYPVLVRIADLGGVSAVSLLVFVVNYTLFRLGHWMRRKQTAAFPSVPLVFCLAFLAGTIAYGLWRNSRPLPEGKPLKVALVHTAVPLKEKHAALYNENVEPYIAYQAALIVQGRQAMTAHPDCRLLVYPEALFSATVLRGQRLSLSSILGAAVLFGSGHFDESSKRGCNAALLDQAGSLDEYLKHHLIPFGEKVPLSGWFTWHEKWLNMRSLARGDGAACMTLDPDIRLAPLICYEILFSGYVREFVNQGAQVLVNITEDGWYGRSGQHYQHNMLARLRAVENNRYLLRCVNNGITAIIDPAGRLISQQADSHTPGVVYGEVPLVSISTVYTQWGDWLLLVLAMGVLPIIGLGLRKNRTSV